MKNAGFTCDNCKKFVSFFSFGTKNRNHCPFCLYSVHVDVSVGDRKSKCKGLMMPVGKVFNKNKEEFIIHRCLECGLERRNRVAGDDSYNLVKSLKELDVSNYL